MLSSSVVNDFWSAEVPRRLSIEITNKCNYRCIHCYHPNHLAVELDKSDVFSTIEQFKNLGLTHLILTGGEALLHPEWKDIVRFAKKRCLHLTIMTNASLVTDDVMAFCESYGVNGFQVSVYTSEPDVYDTITGTQGNYPVFLSALQRLSKSSIPVTASLVMMKQNFNSRKKTKDLCSDLGFSILYGLRILPDRRFASKEQYEITNEQKLQLLQEINQENGVVIKRHNLLTKEQILNARACGAGVTAFNLTAEGNITPCTGFYKVLGNIRVQKVKEILQGKEAIALKKKLRADIMKCNTCPHIQLCTFCPGYVYSEHGDNNAFSDSKLCKEAEVISRILK